MDDLNQEYLDIAESLMEYYRPRNTLFSQMDDMYYSRWDFPEGMPAWVLKVVNTDPHDVIQTTVKTFATLKPKFKIMPMKNDEANRDRANKIETALQYNFHRAGLRNDASVAWDVMFSAAMYAEVAAQVIYLPYQEKVLDAMGVDTRRVKAAKRFGDFAYIIHNPANIYPEWSEYGLEGVLAVRKQTIDEFLKTWGKLAKDMDTSKESLSYVTTYDYTTYEKRVVFAVMSELDAITMEGPGITILEKDNKMGFIPYAIRRFGNSLSTESEERVGPILQSVVNSGQWNMLNVMDSLDASLSIQRAAAARYAGEFPIGKDPEIDNTEPEGMMKLPPGTRNFQPLPGSNVDSRLSANKVDQKARIWQGTVARALQTLEFPSGTAYSSVNQILSTATNSLAPYKLVGQHALEEIAYQMLCWGKYYDKEYGGGKAGLYGAYDTKSKAGDSFEIPYNTIDPDELAIEAILTADVPIDRLQQINGAVLLKNNFKVPEEDLLEDLGIGDPKDASDRRRLDDYKDMFIQSDLKRIIDAQALETAQQQMEMQMQAQQAQQQMAQQGAQQAAQQQQGAATQAAAQGNGAPANDNLGGQGFDPSQGGTPPVQGNPGQGQ